MRKSLFAAAVLLMVGCSSTPTTTYYQLPTDSTVSAVTTTADSTQPAIWVEQVSVPDYLAGNGLVYQTSEVKYVIATSNLWGSPLDQQLKQTLVSNLSRAMPGRLVSATPLGDTHDTLDISVSGFHGRYDGRVIVSGAWVLQHQGQITRREFNLALPQQQDGYDALVKTLALGWQQVAQQIAQNSQASSGGLTR